MIISRSYSRFSHNIGHYYLIFSRNTIFVLIPTLELCKSFRWKVLRWNQWIILYSKKITITISDLIESSQHLGGVEMIFENSKFTKMLVLSFIEFTRLAKYQILDALISANETHFSM